MNAVVVMGASAGGVSALSEILAAIPADFPAPILIVMHIGEHPSMLPTLLARRCALAVRHAADGEALGAGVVLIAPPDRHLLIAAAGGGGEGGPLRVALTRGPKENHSRPAIDTLFRSAAAACGEAAIGVILTGYLDDGVAGLQAIKACGGAAIVQDPAGASVPDLPRHAIEQVDVDLCLPLGAIAGALVAWAHRRAGGVAIEGRDEGTAVPEWLLVENGFAAGEGGMTQLKRIATPSPYSCPECGGTLFAINNTKPCRFRCHTGHSYTLLTLLRRQEEAIEEALAAALRAVQEKENLAEQLASEFAGRSLLPEPGYAALAQHARAEAAALRALMTGTGHRPVSKWKT